MTVRFAGLFLKGHCRSLPPSHGHPFVDGTRVHAGESRPHRRDEWICLPASRHCPGPPNRQQSETVFRPCRTASSNTPSAAPTTRSPPTLLDRQRYPVAALADLYHARWGIEELYKVSKQMLALERFHGQSERLVRQELCAHFSLIAMTLLFTQHSERGFPSEAGKPAMLANFRNGLRTVGQHLQGLFLHYALTLSETVETILASIAGCRQRQRPNRSYPRVSRKPASKWRSRQSTPAPTPA